MPKAACSAGRSRLIHYDDQSNPSTVPGIYTKLLDVDKVDLVLSGYATNMVAPAIPIVMQKNKVFISLFALDANAEFHYPRYFSFIPTSGPTPRQALTEGFFQVAAAQNPKPQDHRDRVGRCRICAQRRGRRPRQRQAVRLQYHLRQELSAEHDRLLAGHPRDPGRPMRTWWWSAPIR